MQASGTLQGTSCCYTHTQIAPKLHALSHEHRCEDKYLWCPALCSGRGNEMGCVRCKVCPGHPEGSAVLVAVTVSAGRKTYTSWMKTLCLCIIMVLKKKKKKLMFQCVASQITVLVRTQRRVSNSAFQCLTHVRHFLYN